MWDFYQRYFVPFGEVLTDMERAGAWTFLLFGCIMYVCVILVGCSLSVIVIIYFCGVGNGVSAFVCVRVFCV